MRTYAQIAFALTLAACLAQVAPVSAQSRRARRAAPTPPASAPSSETQSAAGDGKPADAAASGSASSAGPASSGEGAAVSITPSAPVEGEGAASAAPAKAEEDAPADTGSTEARAAREELAGVMDALVSARARAALLGKSLFKTRVRVLLENEAAEDQALGKVALFLDGNPIYRGEGSALNPEGAKLFEGYAAPGPHVLKVVVEQRSRADDAYRYTQESALHFQVLRGHVTTLKLVLDDDSDIAEDFADDQEGEYDVRLKLEVLAEPMKGAEKS